MDEESGLTHSLATTPTSHADMAGGDEAGERRRLVPDGTKVVEKRKTSVRTKVEQPFMHLKGT